MRIVFHGENAASFSKGFSTLYNGEAEIIVLPDALTTDEEREAYAQADTIVGVKFDQTLPYPTKLKLFHVPGAGYDAVELSSLPPSAVVCNCFGHEQAIAEYVMAAMLARHVPLVDADQRLRQGEWAYWSGSPERVHDEMAGKTIGLLGFGHIGKAIATRAKAFEMAVNVANRSPVSSSNSSIGRSRLTSCPSSGARSTISSSPCHSQRIPKPLSMRRHSQQCVPQPSSLMSAADQPSMSRRCSTHCKAMKSRAQSLIPGIHTRHWTDLRRYRRHCRFTNCLTW